MDCAGGVDSVWVLAGVGAVSYAGSRATTRPPSAFAGDCAAQLTSGFAAHWNKNSKFGQAFDVGS